MLDVIFWIVVVYYLAAAVSQWRTDNEYLRIQNIKNMEMETINA